MKNFFKDPDCKAVVILNIISATTVLMIFAGTASFISYNYHTVYAAAKNATQTTSSSTAKTKESALFNVDVPTIIAAVAAAAAIGGVFWGVYQYRQAQAAKRQEVLFLLVKEFNESKDLNLAKEILGYNYLRNTEEKWLWRHSDDPHYYSVDKLGEILKSDKERSKLSSAHADPGELEIRDSFDNFIVFFGKIGYSLKVGALKRHEILFFKYYIDKAVENKDVERYATTNDFPLYLILVGEYKKYLRLGRLTKWGRYKNEFERVRTYPPAFALEVPTDVFITVNFGEKVSIEENSLTLRDIKNNKPIQGTASLSQDGRTLEFKSSRLAGSTTYIATTTGVRNLAGNTRNTTWKFTTAKNSVPPVDSSNTSQATKTG